MKMAQHMRLCSAAIVMYTHSRIYILSACCSCVRACVCVCLLSSVLRLMRKISNSPKAKQQKMQFTHTHTQLGTPTFLTSQLLVVCADSDILLAAKTNYMKIYCK